MHGEITNTSVYGTTILEITNKILTVNGIEVELLTVTALLRNGGRVSYDFFAGENTIEVNDGRNNGGDNNE